MFKIIEKKITWGGRDLTVETGKIARQADGAVVVKYGNTHVMATVVFAKEAKADMDFFPLTVTYQDKYYAVGKIPGGFFKREGKPTEREILISRLIDRPIRPLFSDDFRNEVQVIVAVLSYDGENSVDFLSIIAASAALAISGVPILGTVGAAKVGFINNNYILNPTKEQMKDSSLELIVAGTPEGVLMVESEAKELSELQMLGAVKFAHAAFTDVITLIDQLKAEVNTIPYKTTSGKTSTESEFQDKLKRFVEQDLTMAFKVTDKAARKEKIANIKTKALENFKHTSLTTKILDVITHDQVPEEVINKNFNNYFHDLEKEIVRTNILEKSLRIDGRNLEEIRPISTEVDLFPQSHGVALFTRGQTQALVFTTLGTESDEQIKDDIEGEERERFMLHYNFPPFSVGEVGRMSGVGRREVGHGKLAWRAINPLLPSKKDFPYTIRVVAEITESNGSSSMATVCGTSLSLMAAGVPMRKPIAGIAMGLIKEGEKFAVLSDILGDEDNLGDMDFKVAGSEDGITALQMDIKITSINYSILEQALNQAKAGRIHILKEMSNSINISRVELNKFAPKIKTVLIQKDKIKDIIGSGGKIIKEMCEVNDVKIDITQEGLVKVSGKNEANIDNALKTINNIVAVAEIGTTYKGTIVKLLEFGAFVNFLGNRDGFLHISEVTDNRNSNINDFLKVGEVLDVKVVNIDDKGKIRLTIKGL
ncbi:Polyribonucleotide nucleotidyltransferase [Candidatus Hepatincolaceae symbiont of Richtersius coronifer]